MSPGLICLLMLLYGFICYRCGRYFEREEMSHNVKEWADAAVRDSMKELKRQTNGSSK